MLVDISKVQDYEVGDGTTSVVVLGEELLQVVMISRHLSHPRWCLVCLPPWCLLSQRGGSSVTIKDIVVVYKAPSLNERLCSKGLA